MAWLRKHAVGIAGVLVPVLYLYLQLQVWKQQGNDVNALAVGIIATALLWCFSIFVIVRYWRDARKAEGLRIAKITMEDDYNTRLEVERRRNEKLAEQTLTLQNEIETLKYQHERAVRNARSVVIHSAKWGAGGIRQIYSIDVTSALKFYLDRYSAQGLELRAAEDPLGDGGYPGVEKELWVRFSCPCIGNAREHIFRDGEVVTFEALCRG
jgi:hypothetical protein